MTVAQWSRIVAEWQAIKAMRRTFERKTMPLKKSASNKARQANIKAEIARGRDPKQAVAIGYSVQRAARKKKRK